MSTTETTAIERSSSLQEARRRLFADVADWVDSCIADFDTVPVTDGHDQGTFTTAWEPYIAATGDTRGLGFMLRLRDRIRDHFESSGKWTHGYWRRQEVHHGTEHTELFLGCLWRLKRDDRETVRQVIDVAEHIGNWVPGVEPWFDWDTGLFRSMYLGTEYVGLEDAMRPNIPTHFRCLNIARLAHHMTGEKRYVDLCVAHATRWADAILTDDSVPAALIPHAPSAEKADGQSAFEGQAGDMNQRINRAENFLASSAIECFLDLCKLAGRDDFKAAAERLLDIIATQLTDPDAGPAADVLRTYRAMTGDARYDRLILDTVKQLDPSSVRELGMDPFPARDSRPSGIGKRQDMPNWFENGMPRRHNPILLAVAAELAQDDDLAREAVDMARAYFALARRVYPHGRKHGCSARTVSAIARGHGRDNNAGTLTGVL